MPLAGACHSHKGGAALPCLHRRSNFIIGIGHPRCGTGFTAHLLQAAGLQIGHEHVRNDGIVSWMLPGERYRNPYRDALGPLDDFHRIFCVTRSPLDAMNSIIPENDDRLSINFRRQILRERFDELLPDPAEDPGGIRTSVLSYTLWFELCLSFLPQLIYRVDRPEDDALLAAYVGRDLSRNDQIKRNSRPRLRATHFTPDALAPLGPDLLHRFGDVAEGLGYPEDAATIRTFAGDRPAETGSDAGA